MHRNTSLIAIATTSTEWEAAMIVTRLREAGVNATATGGYTAGFRAEAPGWVQVLIDSFDQAQAVQIVEQYHRDRAEEHPTQPTNADSNELEFASASASWTNRVRFLVGVSGLVFVASILLLGPIGAFAILGLGSMVVGGAILIRRLFLSTV